MQALELMKTHVVKTTPEATLSEAIDLMDLYQVNGLPVVDGEGRLCGMLTEQDVLRALLSEGAARSLLEDADTGEKAEGGKPDTRTSGRKVRSAAELGLAVEAGGYKVQDWMTQPAISVAETAEVRMAARLMLARHLKRLPVITEEGKVIGVLNRIDVCQALFEGTL
jgi:CBS domain-containing protein